MRQFFYDKPQIPGVFYPPTSDDGKTFIGDAFIVDANEKRIYLNNGDWIEPDGEHYRKIYNPSYTVLPYEPKDLGDDVERNGE